MAEAVLGPLFEDLNSLIHREIGLVRGVKTEIRKLSSTLSTIRAVLADAEVQQIKRREVRDWLMKLKDVAYDAQDILDDWAADDEPDHQSNAATRIHYTDRVRNSFMSLFNLRRLLFRYKIAKQIKETRERFDEIAKEKMDFHLKEGLVDVDGAVATYQCISPSRETSSVSKELQIYGRDADKENIVKILLENMNVDEHVIRVCPIIGIGGLGKTTLAQLVYNDDRVQKHFDVKIWICVSDDFNVKRLLKEIVEVVTKSRFDHDNLDVILDGVKEKLGGNKFLLVLDDVWSDKQDEWNMLKNSLTCGAKGSSIVLTTRLETVASITGTIPVPYQLDSLSKDDCWSLFRSYAFAMGKELEKPNLVRIGKEIVKKCGGLPLAAKALGSLLRFKDEDKHWEQVRDNEIWDLEEEEGNQSPKILAALRLSYNNLSPHARQCFGYCCLFPKDYKMRKEELVHLWLANGLLQAKKMEPENMGENVFRELKLHSFFQDIKEDVEDNKITFKIHDLLHDLASSVMEGEHSYIDPEVGKVRNAINDIQYEEIWPRHVSIILLLPSQSSSIDDVSSIHPFLSSHQHHLRTIFLFLDRDEDEGMSSFDISAISCLKNLRALRIESRKVEISLPLSFGDKLKHLRFVNLSDCGLSSLQAESFRGMKNLQILDLSKNYSLETLPESMGKYMEHLKHLNLRECGLSSLQAESFRGMKNLQILDLSKNYCLKTLPESIGKHLEHLRHLNLRQCNLSSLRAESFNGMKNLQFLNLSWNGEHMKTIPDSIGNLEHLRYLNLSGNRNLELLPESLGNLTELESLKLNGCVGLKTLPQNTSRLCSLRHLENEDCKSLRGMPCGLGQHLTRLEKLSCWVCGRGEIDNIKELRGLSLLGGELLIRITKHLSKEDGAHLDHVELTNKENLSGLHICFDRFLGDFWFDDDDEDGDDGSGSFEQVLRVLKPPFNIEDLRIDGYSGSRFPDWMQMRDPQSSFSRLRSIKLHKMYKVEEWRLNWRDKECLPALEELSIYGCPWLKSLPEELGNLTALKSLEISSCSQLVSMPQLHLMTSLTSLTIFDCPELKFVFHGMRHLTSLQYLYFGRCPRVVILKGELDPLVALRGPSILSRIDKQLIHQSYSQSTTVSEIRGKQVLQGPTNDDDDDNGGSDVSD